MSGLIEVEITHADGVRTQSRKLTPQELQSFVRDLIRYGFTFREEGDVNIATKPGAPSYRWTEPK